MPEPALKDTLEDLEDEIKDETGVDVKLPLDVKDSEVLMVTPSADFFAEPHIDGLIGYAKGISREWCDLDIKFVRFRGCKLWYVYWEL